MFNMLEADWRLRPRCCTPVARSTNVPRREVQFSRFEPFSAFFECSARRRLFIFPPPARHSHASRMQPRGIFKPRSLPTINSVPLATSKPGVENSISGALAPESPKKGSPNYFSNVYRVPNAHQERPISLTWYVGSSISRTRFSP